MLNNKSVLITGGTGSFGKKFVETVLKAYPKLKRLIIFSRDEQKQYEMAQNFPVTRYPALQYVIGDIRDKDRLWRILEGVEIVVHAAAYKQVPTAESNPFECIKTNILGSQNLIECCLDRGVEKVVALSTDKASSPISLYGATKLCADKLFIAADTMQLNHKTTFSVVRYGNVMGSVGSVVPFFMMKKKEGILPITHPSMSRFNILPTESVASVLFALQNAIGGEIFVPKIPSFKITDLAKAICENCIHQIVGVRPGEKIYENMIDESDAPHTIETQKYYIIIPNTFSTAYQANIQKYVLHHHATQVAENFSYNSANNTDWLSVNELKKLIENDDVNLN